MSDYTLNKLKAPRLLYWGIFLFLGFLIVIGLASSSYMEHEGHYVTGMNNQIVSVSYTHLTLPTTTIV